MQVLPQDPRVQGATATMPVAPEKRDQLVEVAQQFESIFIQTLLKSMRDTVQKSGLIDGGRGEEIFTGLLDQRLAEIVSEREGGVGLARMIVHNYVKYVQEPEAPAGAQVDVRAGVDGDDE